MNDRQYPAPDTDPNPDHTPGKNERKILDYLATEGRANPWMIRKRLDWRGQRVNDKLKPLLAAKWIVRPRVYDRENNKHVEAHAMYQYNAHDVYDPRPVAVALGDETAEDWATYTVADIETILEAGVSPERVRAFYDYERAGPQRKSAFKLLERKYDRIAGPDEPVLPPRAPDENTAESRSNANASS